MFSFNIRGLFIFGEGGSKFYGLNRNYIEIMFWCNFGDRCFLFVN